MQQPELKLEWGVLATFIPNKKAPVYNWLYYKEGYSAELVFKLIEMFRLERNHTVLDPFAGVGTTLLACKQRGINAVGVDVQPVAVFASSVKTRDYDVEKLREAIRSLLDNKFEKPRKVEPPAIVKKCFSRYALEDIVFFRRHINNVEDEDVRNFLLLGLVNAAMKVSWAWKDGGVIKVKKHPSPPLRKMLSKTLGRMVKDLEKLQESANLSPQSTESTEALRPGISVSVADARRLPFGDDSIDAVITSPPYLNQIDYQKVYAIENWIVSGEPAPAVRSFIGSSEAEQIVPDAPPHAQAYFRDMDAVLGELWRVCRSGARLGIVIGNAYFDPPYSPIESDVVLAELAEKRGFVTEKILVLNQRAALKNRTEKVGLLRESLVLLRKP